MIFNKKHLTKLQQGALGGGTIYIVAILFLLVGFGSVLTNGLLPPDKLPTGAAVTIVPPAPDAEKKNLQLYTFGYTTPAPTPTTAPTPQVVPTLPQRGSCPLEKIKTQGCGACFPEAEMVACDEKPCNSPGMDVSQRSIFDPQYTTYNCGYLEISGEAIFQQKLSQPNCRGACVAKPIIYLYPTVATLINVKVKVPGKIIVSDPLYPVDGWKNVLAQPNGQLTYKNKAYNELFFESDVDKVNAPDNGIIISKKDLKEKLSDATNKLGLIGNEQTEFLDYWLPVLNNLNEPYILFSVIDPTEKERIDHVDIYPTPDTKIEFLAYFKPQHTSETTLKPLKLPDTPPARLGFTSVEWGGTIALK